MQQTKNYNLLIPEGTDIVNPLTQVNPNFQTIDGAMFANKQSSIGTATEVVTGTVHAINRSNTDSDVFRFTATGAWTAGDTMTLDGQSVTVHLSDGTAPATGSYIIGAEVVAVVKGTLVTLLTSSAAIDPGVTSFNSRTGAVVPTASDYDASMIDYDNTASGLNATDVQGAIDEIAGDIKDSGWVVVTSNLKYRKIGAVVYIELVSGNGTGWVVEGNLPVGYRPAIDFTSCVYTDTTNSCNFRVKPDGDVSYYTTSAGITGIISFITA